MEAKGRPKPGNKKSYLEHCTAVGSGNDSPRSYKLKQLKASTGLVGSSIACLYEVICIAKWDHVRSSTADAIRSSVCMKDLTGAIGSLSVMFMDNCVSMECYGWTAERNQPQNLGKFSRLSS